MAANNMYQLVDGVWQELESEQRTESHVYIDGNLLQDYGIDVEITSQEPISPPIFNRTLSIPGMPGAWDFGGELEPKMIILDCVFPHQSYGDFKRQIREFNKLLFDEYGKPKEVKLVFGDEMDVFINARVSAGIDVDRTFKRGFASVEFIAHDPFKYATANEYDPVKDYRYDEGYDYDIGLMYDNPKSFKWQYSKHYSGVNNYSSLVTDFVIEIQGTVQNGSVTNLENNQKLTLPNISNGRLVIDGKRFAIIRNGTAILEGSNYNFFHIQPGEVGFLFEADNANATVTYKWLHKFN